MTTRTELRITQAIVALLGALMVASMAGGPGDVPGAPVGRTGNDIVLTDANGVGRVWIGDGGIDMYDADGAWRLHLGPGNALFLDSAERPGVEISSDRIEVKDAAGLPAAELNAGGLSAQ